MQVHGTNKVFVIPELLEEILHYVPLKILFVVQRVNTTFRNTIAGSERLQRKMVLRQSPVVPNQDFPCADLLMNHLLVETWIRDHNFSNVFCDYQRKDLSVSCYMHINFSLYNLSTGRSWLRKSKSSKVPALPHDLHASWRRTKITTMPCVVHVSIAVSWRTYIYRDIMFLEGQGTLGDVDKCVRDYLRMTDEERDQDNGVHFNRYIWQPTGELQPGWVYF